MANHKSSCGEERVAGLKSMTLPRLFDSTELLRLVRLETPPSEHLSAIICFCCGSLLKKCRTEFNVEEDVLGLFFVEAPCEEPFPAKLLLGEVGSTGFYTGVGKSDTGESVVAACLQCAHALRENEPALHLDRCRAYLDVGRLRLPSGIDKLSLLESRLIAPVNLYANPDLSSGPASIAGVFTNDKIKVPFSFKELESFAFPHLFFHGKETWSNSREDMRLLDYTMMRFYSVDPRWRTNADYIIFSVHRLVAFGIWDISTIASIPEALPLSRRNELFNFEFMIRDYSPK